FGRLDATDEDVRLAFVELGLDGWVDGLADGIDTMVGERGEHLSAGERQLVALARAYVANPPCLVPAEAPRSRDPPPQAPPPPGPAWPGRWRACRAGAPRSPSPPGSPPRPAPTGCWCSTAAASSSRAATTTWCGRAACTPGCTPAGSTPPRRRWRAPQRRTP